MLLTEQNILPDIPLIGSNKGLPTRENMAAADTNTATRLEHKHKDDTLRHRISILCFQAKKKTQNQFTDHFLFLSPPCHTVYSDIFKASEKEKQLPRHSHMLLALMAVLSDAKYMATIEPRERPKIPTLSGTT